MNRGAKLRNDKEITTTLTAASAVRTAVGGQIWSKIPGKACVKILINKCEDTYKHKRFITQVIIQYPVSNRVVKMDSSSGKYRLIYGGSSSRSQPYL